MDIRLHHISLSQMQGNHYYSRLSGRLVEDSAGAISLSLTARRRTLNIDKLEKYFDASEGHRVCGMEMINHLRVCRSPCCMTWEAMKFVLCPRMVNQSLENQAAVILSCDLAWDTQSIPIYPILYCLVEDHSVSGLAA